MDQYITVPSLANISKEPKSTCLELSNGAKFVEGWRSEHEGVHHQERIFCCQFMETQSILTIDALGSKMRSQHHFV